MKNKTNLICFDLDGVLIHSMTVANQIFFDTVEEKLGLPTEPYRNDKHLMSMSAEERFSLLWSAEIRERGIKPGDIEKTLTLYRQRKLEAKIPLLPHAQEAVELMAKHFELLAVVSSNPKEVIEKTLDRLNLKHYFAHLQGIDQIPFSKPHPQIYQVAAESMGVDPTDALTFEDSIAGIVSAKGAGMKVIALATGLESVEDLQKTPADIILKDFSELKLSMMEELLGINV